VARWGIFKWPQVGDFGWPSGKKNSSLYDGYERFLIAHEVGHYILTRKLNALSLNKKDYWKHEWVCDFFARCVLLPEADVKKHLQQIKDTSDLNQIYNFSIYLLDSTEFLSCEVNV
jgi:Zn-dependent peptidase ImmA (M78 family)